MVTDAEQGTGHTLLRVNPPKDGAALTVGSRAQDYYNIVMVDVSGSMHSWWTPLMEQWNTIVSSKLKGTGDTEIYTFGHDVKFRRKETFLKDSDFDSSSTNLTEGVDVIYSSVKKCKQSNVRVFLITDGGHNCGDPEPEEIINEMFCPPDKTLEVYLIGIGNGFPVTLSVALRSHLHTGSSSCPTIFWAKDPSCDWSQQNEETLRVMEDTLLQVEEELSKSLFRVSLSIPGTRLPMSDDFCDEATAGEFIFFIDDPATLCQSLEIKDDQSKVPLNPNIEEADAEFLVGRLFKQWNAVLVQRHHNKKSVPLEIFTLMEKAFEISMDSYKKQNIPSGDGIKKRLIQKKLRMFETDFKTMMNQSKNLICLEKKYENEIELAEAILKTTVQSKYNTRLLQIRGHSDQDWNEDVKKFRQIYNSLKAKIGGAPTPNSDDCCRVLLTSFMGDLQDSDFEMLLSESKVDFLNAMNFTGIPVFAPVKDSAQINPWTLKMINILVSPFEILSQRVLESSFNVKSCDSESEELSDKAVTLQEDDPNSKFNIIVPILSVDQAQLLKKLVRTNVFSAGATFCILKNALILDNNCHIAALACVWLKTICGLGKKDAQEYLQRRLACIESTAALYLDRPDIKLYLDALIEEPWNAMVTEIENFKEGKSLKCESLVKPLFFVYMVRERISKETSSKLRKVKPLSSVVQMVIAEFFGRTLHSAERNTPYMDFLLNNSTEETRKLWMDDISKSLIKKMNYSSEKLLQQFFCPEDLMKHTHNEVLKNVESMIDSKDVIDLNISPNMNSIAKLSNLGAAGHVRWNALRGWAEYLSRPSDSPEGARLSEKDVDNIFSPKKIAAYIHFALKSKNSKERWNCAVNFELKESVKNEIETNLKNEQRKLLKSDLFNKVQEHVLQLWTQEYLKVHQDVAVPLTRGEIIARATARGYPVTEDSFSSVYKYRERVGLSRNSCHVERCPHFLRPDNRFNCHLIVERKFADYPHNLHLVTSLEKNSEKRVNEVRQEMVDLRNSKAPRKKAVDLVAQTSNSKDSTHSEDSVETNQAEPNMKITVYPVEDLIMSLKPLYEKFRIN